VREKLVEALNNLRPKLNNTFYGLKEIEKQAEEPSATFDETRSQ
jgi:hypothetical protein